VRTDLTTRLLRSRALEVAALVAIAALVLGVLAPLALTRYVHVDECQVAYNAALIGRHQLPSFTNFHSPLVAPLAWLASREGDTWDLIVQFRSLFLALFLGNLILVAVCAPHVAGWGPRTLVLLAALLVEPLWRHGFEIRHDAILLASSLGMAYLAARAAAKPSGQAIFLAAGALGAVMQLNSLKAFLYWPPGLALIYAAASWRLGKNLRPGRAIVATTIGAAAMLVFGAALLMSAGVGTIALENLVYFASLATEYRGFGSGDRLVSLLKELPHLAILSVVSIALTLASLRRKRWEAELPSVVVVSWLAIQLVALHLNPTPFSYNFVHVLPFLFLAALDGAFRIARLLTRSARACWYVLLFVVSFASFAWSWNREVIGRASALPQRMHVEAVESLTSLADPVLDGAGLVLSRRPPGPDWMLHSLTMPAYKRGDVTTFESHLRREAVPVLLTNYRWEWLGAGERQLVRARYVALGPRLLALGGTRSTAGSFELYRAGRYKFAPASSATRLNVDGAPLPSSGVIWLEAGEHALSAPASWVWLGPSLDSPPRPQSTYWNRDLFISD